MISVCASVPAAVMAQYQAGDKTKARVIVYNADYKAPYKPVLEVPANHNKQGYANVYKGEYAVYASINNQRLVSKLSQLNQEAYKGAPNQVAITPHISVIQGVFKGKSYEEMLAAVKEVAQTTSKQTVSLQGTIEAENGNLALAVSKESKAFFDHITAVLTTQTHPTAAMKQTLDDIKSEKADLSEMYDGGAWRDFNIPGNNNPHVTFAYHIQDNKALKESLNNSLDGRQYQFNANELAVAKIDENGNIYGQPVLRVKFV